VSVIDLSTRGALVQAMRPLRPGARVLLQLAIDERSVALSAHVLRCAVWSLDALAGPTYRGALQFEHQCERLGEARTHGGAALPASGKSESAISGHRLPGPDRQPSVAVRRSAK
jgi:hypothetical protein